MPNTYSQIHLQVVFAVKHRKALISPEWSDGLYGYITGIIQGNGHKMLIINGMPDHIHILFGMRPHQALSDLMRQVKCDSTKWINQRGLTAHPFSWQTGYGAFSYSLSQVPRIIRYIENQQKHHQQKSLRQEYVTTLEMHGIPYDDQYIFQDLEG